MNTRLRSTDDQLKSTELQVPTALNREAIHCFHSEESDKYIFTKNSSIYKDYILPLKGVCNNHLF